MYPYDYETYSFYGFALAWVVIHLIMTYRGYRCIKNGKKKLRWTSRDDYMIHGIGDARAIGVKSNNNRQPNENYWSNDACADSMEMARISSRFGSFII